MNILLLAGAASIAFISAAVAADMPTPPPVEEVYVEPSSWEGWFGGIQGGYGWGEVDYDFLDPNGDIPAAEVSGDFDVDGFVGGLYYGRNWQSGQWVYGLEGSISGADISGGVTISNHSGTLTVDGIDIADDDPFDLEVTLRAFSTNRVKVGMAFDNFMIFAAAGLTGGFMEAELSGPLGAVDDDQFAFGWTAGAGVEAMVSENWSARVEYLYLDYCDETFFGGTDGEVDINLDAHVVRGGIAYHF